MKKTILKQAKQIRRKLRIRARVIGTSDRPRLVVSRSLKYTRCQVIDDTKGGKVLIAVFDQAKKVTGTKTERAKKLGEQVAQLAKERNITKVVFDRGGRRYHGRVKAVAEGARSGGLIF
jgi:large subunit ribosomal protein L18